MTALTDWTPQDVAAVIRAARRILAGVSGVRCVWIFGSVARGDRLDWLSDLDLAVEGLAPEAQFKVRAQLEDEFRCPVDLVRIEDAPTALRRQIESRGRLIHEA